MGVAIAWRHLAFRGVYTMGTRARRPAGDDGDDKDDVLRGFLVGPILSGSKRTYVRMSYLTPCPCCNAELVSKDTKAGKPYFRCKDCGVQIFVRYDEGIAKLKKRGKKREPENTPEPDALSV